MDNQLIGTELSGNLEKLKAAFAHSSDIIFREFKVGNGQKGLLIFVDGLINMKLIDEDVLQPLIAFASQSPQSLKQLESLVSERVITAAQISTGTEIAGLIDHVLSGDTALLLDGLAEALFIGAREWDSRAVSEPATEAVIRGPREGFTENLRTNTSLIRRRLKTPHLKMESMKVGRLSKTDIVISYLDNLADSSIVAEVRDRIRKVDIDAILESGYIEELIGDSPYSMFPLLMTTERPDKVAGCLLEGKVAIITDNTPFVLIVPMTFYGMLQASEDYYEKFLFMTAVRWLRFLSMIIALLLPSVYIALLTFELEMIPTNLVYSIAAGRETVPFPALVEAFLMEVSFEALREAGVRLPRPIGQSVSIVGGLVIGQAAVQAGLVSAPLVIVVSLTGIASFIIPNYSHAITIRLLRFPIMILAGTLGFYGVLIGVLFLLSHMCRLRSFGTPYLSPIAPLRFGDLKDVLIRAPWWRMSYRPEGSTPGNQRRLGNQTKGNPSKP
ncbi:spore germination protein [Paenibacillus rhizophilus]|uniref:Spore germination protein n=1 Tax=Paenibacillus rhizophilus TaxID=1850366 RepID=A0A3N9PBZ9_9BACL|nr:spore germination protein [Paenibacillus rhizophilus]RQW13010.1 spore germination protein [Paenibacillus rhizophilus]